MPKCNDAGEDDTLSLLHNYFALSLSLPSLYKQWAASDPNFARRAPAFTGIRILNQDAWETIVAFICSSNNHISRISQMVEKLCTYYGPYIGTIDGERFHDLPLPEALLGATVEEHLRELGFGYRAKYIAQTARLMVSYKSAGWLLRIRNPDSLAFGARLDEQKKRDDRAGAEPASYRAAHKALLSLPGVGPKVADCVCLMGLGWGESVPIDTHLWQIAQRDYNFGKGNKTKTLTKTMYDAVGDHFRKIWGPQAGWAQSVLFTANLKSFAEQASAVKSKTVVDTAEIEKTAEAQPHVSSDSRTTTVSVDAGQVTATSNAVSRTRKRKIATSKQPGEGEGRSSEVVLVETSTLRRSKRRKATVM
jgi:N-glycosylase/DNA lyase